MKINHSLLLTLVLLVALFALGGCNSSEPATEDVVVVPVIEPEVIEPPAEPEEQKTIFGGPTSITTGIPKVQIVQSWQNSEDFSSLTVVTFDLDETGTFKNAESSFTFDYDFVNSKIMQLDATSGKTFTDENILKFIGPQGGPLGKNYQMPDDKTLVIGEITFTKVVSA
jgi:hypothetical protein